MLRPVRPKSVPPSPNSTPADVILAVREGHAALLHSLNNSLQAIRLELGAQRKAIKLFAADQLAKAEAEAAAEAAKEEKS